MVHSGRDAPVHAAERALDETEKEKDVRCGEEGGEMDAGMWDKQERKRDVDRERVRVKHGGMVHA